MVDGGLEYVRRGWTSLKDAPGAQTPDEVMDDLCEYEEEPNG